MAVSTRLQFVERDIKVMLDRDLSQAVLGKKLAEFARKDRDEYLASVGGHPTYQTIVNGRIGIPEEQVILPGPIVYSFSWLRPIAQAGLEWLQRESPRLSGDYARGHFAMYNGSEIDIAQLPAEATEIVLTNDLPFSRKLHVGGMKTSAPPKIFEQCRQAILAKFGQVVEAQVRFLHLTGTARNGDPLPYRLKTDGNMRSTASGADQPWSLLKRNRPKVGRKDRFAGMPITYPSVVITVKE